MKKIFIIFVLLFAFNSVQAHPHGYYRYSGCSSCVYIVKSDNYQSVQKINNSDRYSMLIDTTVNFYSNGAKRVFNNYSILNSDGSILITDSTDIKPVFNNNKHYFLARKGKYYKIFDENGIEKTKRQYNKMSVISSNKILVLSNKLYGVIDIDENIIVPIKYKTFERLGENLYLTKLNGYYGLIDSSNNILLKNEFDKIKPLYDTYIAKKADKYCLVDFNGNKILDCEYDKIKKLGEYILIKKDKKYGVLDSSGNKITEVEYKKIKLERNQLLLLKDKEWESI